MKLNRAKRYVLKLSHLTRVGLSSYFTSLRQVDGIRMAEYMERYEKKNLTKIHHDDREKLTQLTSNTLFCRYCYQVCVFVTIKVWRSCWLTIVLGLMIFSQSTRITIILRYYLFRNLVTFATIYTMCFDQLASPFMALTDLLSVWSILVPF